MSIPRVQVAMVAAAIEQYHGDTGRWPASLETLLDGGLPGLGPYLRNAHLRDRWERRLFYSADPDGSGFTVFSLGRDGRLGGSGADADVGKALPDQLQGDGFRH